MQMYRFRNPHTGAPPLGPLAILVDAQALGDDGNVAITARVTAYR